MLLRLTSKLAAKSLTKDSTAPKLVAYGAYRRIAMKRSPIPLIALAFWLTVGVRPGLAAPDEYDDSQSHPLRVTAYLLLPIGWLAEWLVYRPFHYLVSATEPQEAFFGHHPHPALLGESQPIQDYGMPKRVRVLQTASQPSPPAPVPPPESVRIVEVPVE